MAETDRRTLLFKYLQNKDGKVEFKDLSQAFAIAGLRPCNEKDIEQIKKDESLDMQKPLEMQPPMRLPTFHRILSNSEKQQKEQLEKIKKSDRPLMKKMQDASGLINLRDNYDEFDAYETFKHSHDQMLRQQIKPWTKYKSELFFYAHNMYICEQKFSEEVAQPDGAGEQQDGKQLQIIFKTVKHFRKAMLPNSQGLLEKFEELQLRRPYAVLQKEVDEGGQESDESKAYDNYFDSIQ